MSNNIHNKKQFRFEGANENTVTLISTTYNDEKEIVSLLEDVFDQSVGFFELIIADGGSTDKTVEIIQSYSERYKKVRLISGTRLNISQGLNTAIRACKTEYVSIVMTGNRYDSEYLRELYAKIGEKERIAFPPIRGAVRNDFSRIYCKAFLHGSLGNRIPSNHGGLINRQIFKDYGLFYEKFIYAGEDAEFYNRIPKDEKIKCAENAILEWDVPSNFKQLKKQAKAYMIANNQIYGLKALKDYLSIFVRLIVYLICLVFSIVNPYFLLFSVLLLIASYNGVFRGKDFLSVTMYKWRHILKMYYSIRYIKYTGDKYRVNPKYIEYL